MKRIVQVMELEGRDYRCCLCRDELASIYIIIQPSNGAPATMFPVTPACLLRELDEGARGQYLLEQAGLLRTTHAMVETSSDVMGG